MRLLLACALALSSQAAPAARLERIWPSLDFDLPVALAFAPGDPARAFVAEQDGRILELALRGESATAAVLLDLRDRVLRDHRESGLLNLVLHPGFRENGLLYVWYTARGHRNRLSSFRSGDPRSERILLEAGQPFRNHNGGGLAFGPDGLLYVGLGDGGGAGDPFGHAQDPGSPLGKILRLDVEDPRPEVFALGLRNPWRLAFDPETGELWEADPGQDSLEEINLVVRGGNYGWNRMEGSRPFRRGPGGPFVAPVAEYRDEERGQCVIGGVVREGVYVFGDYLSGRIWGLRKGGKPFLMAEDEGLLPASFAGDPRGGILVVSHAGGIWRLAPGE